MKTTYPQIPPITDPLGKYWKQPDPAKIKILFGKAWMDKEDFDKLLDYSRSKPTGIYYGKMWKATDDGKTWYLKYITEAITKDPEFHTTWTIPIMLN